MKTRISEQGLLIPKQWFEGVEEVEVRRENDRIVIVPLGVEDPIHKLGKQPITVAETDKPANADDPLYRLGELAAPTGIPDLALNIDHYLYSHPRVRNDQE